MAVECTGSDKHWAEPCVFTVEEALERMETGTGMRISSAHPNRVHVLFADGTVEGLRANMPISMWAKLLMGELKSRDELQEYQATAGEPSDNPVPFMLSILVWLVSIAMLFRRAWKSRAIPAVEKPGGAEQPL